MTNIDYYTNVSRDRNYILVRGIKDRKRVLHKLRYSPTLYSECTEDTGFKTIYGKNLKPFNFDTMGDAYQFVAERKDTSSTVYGFPNYQSQFILENYKNSVDTFDKGCIRVFQIDIEVFGEGGFPSPEKAEAPVTALTIYDSLVDKFIVFGIGQWSHSKSNIPEDVLKKVVYNECANEQQLLRLFFAYWKANYPDIISGWNVEGFDIPYLYNRLEKLGFDVKFMSPWGLTKKKERETPSGVELSIELTGIDIVDYIKLYKKNYVQESYKLDYIAQVELGEKKSLETNVMLDLSRTPFTKDIPLNDYDYNDDPEYNEFVKFRKERLVLISSNNPNKDLELEIVLRQEKQAAFQAFITYNIQDVNIVKLLDKKKGLIDAQIMIAYEACMNYEDVFSPVRTWDCLINKELYSNNIIPHYDIDKKKFVETIPGGYVKEPQLGKHGWCLSFDLNSLYPHLIMQFNISPETLDKSYQLWPGMSDEDRVQRMLNNEPHDCDPSYSLAASGYRFRNDIEGVIPRLMSKMYSDRKKYKKLMLEKKKKGENASIEELRQYVLKILLNSGYGAQINKYFRWFELRLGKSITLSGQFVIQSAEQALNGLLNNSCKTENVDYIIAIDTDSNYINVQPLVDMYYKDKTTEEIVDILNDISENLIQKVLEKKFESIKNYTNAYSQKMVMEREVIASSAFWTAKKKYAMQVHDKEGVRKKDFKIQGLEAIRSSTPYVCRKPFLEMIDIILNKDEKTLQEYMKNYKEEFLQLKPELIAVPMTIGNLAKYTDGSGFAPKTPPHVKGAISFNRLLKKHKLETSWETVKEDEKAKVIYLRTPNPTGIEVITFVTNIPKEIGLNGYIDMEKMYEKIIISPLEGILEPIGWTVVKKLTVESFFE